MRGDKVPDASKAFGHDVKNRDTEAPAGAKGKGSDVGNEKRAPVRVAQETGDRGGQDPENRGNLRKAVRELEKQHPHHHSQGGMHETREHDRHERLGGLKPSRER